MEEVGKWTAELEKYYNVHGTDGIHAHLKTLGFEPSRFYQELEMTSRYVDTHQDMSMSNSQVSLHSHTFYEILCCQNTCDVEYLVGAERYRLQKGDVVIIPPGVSHRPLLPEHMAEPYRRDVMWLSQEFAATMPHLLPEEMAKSPQLLRIAGTQWEFLADMFRNGVREYEQQRLGW